MKTFIEHLSEDEKNQKRKVNIDAIKHHGHMMALYRTRNMLNPQVAARKEMNKHLNKLKNHGVEVTKHGGVKHSDSSAQQSLQTGIAQGVGVEYDAQPKYRHDTVGKSSKIRKEVGDFTGLDAYRKATGKLN